MCTLKSWQYANITKSKKQKIKYQKYTQKPFHTCLKYLCILFKVYHCHYSQRLRAIFFAYILKFYLFIFRQRGRERGRVGEKCQCVVASHTPPTGDLACSPGICPDWVSNQQPFGHRLALNPLSHTSQGYFFFCLLLMFI